MKAKRTQQVRVKELKGFRSLLDLYKRTGAIAHKVSRKGQVPVDSMLAVYQDHLTYTFMMDKEVASIHYDVQRQEIFFKGHNIKNIELTDDQRHALMDLGEVLLKDKQGVKFYPQYGATLARILADKVNR